MTFPLALAVGIEGEDEVMEVELAETLPAEELLRRLSQQASPGLVFRSLEVLPPGSRKARARSASYQVPVPPSCRRGLEDRIGRSGRPVLAVPAPPAARPSTSAPTSSR